MDQTTLIAIDGIIAVLLIVFAVLAMQRRKSRALRDRFGDEYDRTVDARGGRRNAEADLLEREERVQSLDIRPLGPQERDRFQGEWKDAKALFVDSPNEAISRSDRLIGEVMTLRGYPMTDFEHRHADLTVQHGDVAREYLAGHEIADRAAQGDATTEELRRAMNHYERLFERLVNDTSDTVENRPVSAPAQS